jgi:hypothetical protein
MKSYFFFYTISFFLFFNNIKCYINNYNEYSNFINNNKNNNLLSDGYDHRHPLYNNNKEELQNIKNKFNKFCLQLQLIKILENKKNKNNIEKLELLKKYGSLNENYIRPSNIFVDLEKYDGIDL